MEFAYLTARAAVDQGVEDNVIIYSRAYLEANAQYNGLSQKNTQAEELAGLSKSRRPESKRAKPRREGVRSLRCHGFQPFSSGFRP